jgi:glycosyltransferase involved in cell wall biosynthesis
LTVEASRLPRPLISCVLPTYNRRGFLPHAIHYFLRQDYPERELVVVDDGPDAVGDLIPADPRIRYIRLPQKITLGAKLNLCCAEARGPIIAQWDDDDWYGNDRLSRQMEALVRTNADVCGISDLLYLDLGRGGGHRYVYPAHERPWLLGASLFFRRELWERNRFVEVDVGMDALFVWATPPEKVHALPAPRFAVHLNHHNNVSPKSPQGAWWSDHPVSEIADLMGADWQYYAPGGDALSCPRPRPLVGGPVEVETSVRLEVVADEAEPARRPAHNVYACLVHEARDCVIDLCRNLRKVDPESTILLYDGGHDRALLAPDPVLESLGAVVHPSPRPMRWGSLHDFALDCMRFAQVSHPFDTLTIVDSDQLALRPGWTARIQEYLEREPGVGLLGNQAERLLPHTDNAAALTAWQEVDLWRPLLRRFPGGEDKFVHWSFWPSTVFSADAARALVQLFDDDEQLREILGRSHLWVTEEILFPTLTALLGFRVARSPGSYEFMRYRHPYTPHELESAFARPDAYWIHPIPRQHEDPLRAAIRARLEPPAPPAPQPSAEHADVRSVRLNELRQPILAQMRQVSGWLGDDEADLLITVTDRALATCPEARALVEVGSFRGKGTTVLAAVVREMRPAARVWAVDPHDGIVGALDQGVSHEGPTLDQFRNNIARAGLQTFVETVQARAADVAWSEPICLLLVDGLHDYDSVARDFRQFEAHLADSALVAFHDYADYFPGVKRFVDELLRDGDYALVEKASSLIVLAKRARAIPAVAASETLIEARVVLA